MGVVYPTVALGVGALGHAVVDRLTASLESDEVLLRVLRCAPADVEADLGGALAALLEAGRNAAHLAEPRLDLLLFAHGWGQDGVDLVSVSAQAASVVGHRYGAIFPADRPPAQRTAVLHLVVLVPPLTGPDAVPVLRQLQRLERWAESDAPAYPLLSRVWLLSTHTQAGILSKADVVASAAAFGIALTGSGLREEDAITRRMAHHTGGEGLFAFFSGASLDLPKARLRAYATERAVYDGAAALVRRVEQEADPSVAVSTIAALRSEEWLQPFVDGEPAHRCRQLAASLSGATTALPDRIKIDPFDEAEDIRSRYAILFRPATQVRPPTHADASQLDEMIMGLDKAESASFRQMRSGVERLFTVTLGARTGLSELSVVEAGLRRLLASLQDGDAHEERSPDQGPVHADPLRGELEEALGGLPSRSMLLAVACTVGVTVGLLVVLVGMGVTVAADLDAQSHPDTVRGVRLALWGIAALGTVLGSYLFARWVGARTRATVQEALKRRRDAVFDLWKMGGGGQPGRQAEAQLRQRRLRVRRGAIRLIEGTLEHTQAIRRSLLEARDQAHRRLSELCANPQPDASLDDLRDLLGAPRPLHAPLVSPEVANWWVRSCREIADNSVWANRLLEGAWPASGLSVDLPCADLDQLRALGRKQTSPLVERNLFSDPQGAEAAAAVVSAFTARAPRALAPPVQPRDAHGDPAMGVRRGEMFAVAPVEARAVLQTIFADAPMALPALWTTARAERVLFVRTWEGHRLAELARGAGVSLDETAKG